MYTVGIVHYIYFIYYLAATDCAGWSSLIDLSDIVIMYVK